MRKISLTPLPPSWRDSNNHVHNLCWLYALDLFFNVIHAERYKIIIIWKWTPVNSSFNKFILDTPCAAGARSTSFHPAANPGRQMSQRQKRQFDEDLPRGAVPGRIWKNIVFVHILQKKLQTAAENGSLNRQLPALKRTWEQFTFGSFKIKSSNYQCPVAVKPPPYTPRKNQLSSERTDGRNTTGFDVQHGWKERFAQ